jgi:uncharacterized membrane protein YfcA
MICVKNRFDFFGLSFMNRGMDFLILLAYALIGLLAGIIGGLFGISGGLVTIPCLVLIFHFLDFPKEVLVHMAIGTSLSAMVFNAIASAWSHHRKGGVIWPIVKAMLPGLFLGAIAGSLVARILSDTLLQDVFGYFECLMGIYFLLPFKEKNYEHHLHPGTLGLSAIGFGIGGLSSVLGIGGGIITVPILLAIHVPMKKAIGTSAATGFLITFIAAIAYLILGYGKTTLPDSIGYLYLPAFLMIGIVTAFAAPFGAKLSSILPTPILRRAFAVVLFIAGVLMLI